MTPFRNETALYYLKTGRCLSGRSEGYIDDLFRCENPQFWNFSKKTEEASKMKGKYSFTFDFMGYTIKKLKNGTVVINKNGQLAKLEKLRLNPSSRQFR